MKKFIILDHSLCNLQGHHYECSLAVAEAVQRAGYKSIIFANRVLPHSLTLGEIQIIPAFEVDWFNNPTLVDTPESQPEKLSSETNKTFKDIFLYRKYIWENKNPKFSLFFEKVEGSTQRLFQWIKDDLQLLRSIPLSNTLWGLFKIVWGLAYFIFKIGFESIQKTVVRTKPNSEVPIQKVQSFTETLAEILSSLNLTSEDQILIHTFGIEQLEELYYFLEKSDRSSLPTYHLLFRRDTEEPLVKNAKGLGLRVCLQRFYESKLWPDKIRFYTDTEDLVRKYNALSPVWVSQVPIPFRHEKLQLEQAKIQKDFIHLVYLGDARSEKGYQHLPKLVADLWTDYLQPGKVKFTIQSNYNVQGGEAEILAAKLNLYQYPEHKVRLIETPLTPDNYYQLLASADIVILPYNPQNYQRTSGVLTESLAAGKPVVVPKNSWLAQQVDETRASIYESPQDLTQAVIRLLDDLPCFTKAAEEFSVNWRSQQSPDYFLQCLLKPIIWEGKKDDQQSITPPKATSKILLVLNAHVAVQRKNWQMVSYFNQCGYQVYGIFYTLDNRIDLDDLRSQLAYSGLQHYWILTDKHETINRQNFTPEEYHNYLDNCYYQRSSLWQDWMEASRLSIPHDLVSRLSNININLVYIDSIFCSHILKEIGLSSQITILRILQLYSYTQAIQDQKEVDQQEFIWEIDQLKQYSILLTETEPLAEKLQALTSNAQIFMLYRNQEQKEINYQSLNQACQIILNDQALPIEQLKSSPRVAVLYPWGDIQERKTGASKRTGLMLDYLHESGYQTRLYTIGQRRSLWSEGVYYDYYEPHFEQAELVKNVYQEAFQSWQTDLLLVESQNINEESESQDHWLPWIYYQFRFDPSFKEWLEKITDWADVVILEYPFWGLILGESCKRKNVKFILTAHDVLAKNLPLETPLGQIALGEELQSLKNADQVVTLTPDDQSFFATYGIYSRCIPIAIDTEKIKQAQEEQHRHQSRCLLGKILGKNTEEIKPFCLFIGSQHQPNIEAAKEIHQWSQKKSLGFDLVVVGRCWEQDRDKNFLALGEVTEEDLACLYWHSSIVLAPLTEGTGMSVKTLEALAYGQVVLGTAIAFRGYPVESSINCLICDNLEDYPDKINQLIQKPDVLATIGQQAKEFSLAYDYRKLYKSYLDLIL